MSEPARTDPHLETRSAPPAPGPDSPSRWRLERGSRSSRAWGAAVAAYLVYAAALLAPVWLQLVEPKWDAVDYFYPAFAFMRDALLNGRAPLWDPYTNCGLPFLADPQAPLLDPLAVVLAPAASSASKGFALYWSIHWAWAGLGSMLLAFALGAGPGGALVSGIAYAFSGFFVGNAQHTSWIVTAGWLPWTFGLAHLAVFRRAGPLDRWGYALLASVAAGLSALGGYPGLVSFTPVALALWLGAAALSDSQGSPRWHVLGRAAAVVGVVTTLLALIWAPGLYAFLTEAAQYTDRTGPLPREVANFQSPFTLRAAVSLLFPRAVLELRKTIPSDVSMINGYIGALAVPLAAAWVRARTVRRSGWILAFAAFMFVVSLGGEAGLRSVLYEVLPPTRYMRHNAGFRIFWILPLAAAAGAGFTAAFERRDTLRFTAAAALGWLVVAVGISAWLRFELDRVGLDGHGVASALAPGLAAVAIGAAVLVAAGSTRAGAWPRVASGAVVLLFGADLAVHLHVQSGARTAWTAPGAIARLEHMNAVGDTAGARVDLVTHSNAARTLGSLNFHQVLRIPVVEGYVTMRAQGFNDRLVPSRFGEVLAAHRFWLSPSTAEAPFDGAEIPILVPLGAADPLPVLVDAGGPVLAGDAMVPGAYGSVDVRSYEPEQVILDVDVPAGPGAVLASTERHAPGWMVDVDGRHAALLRVNRWFRGVQVPPGQHRVVFRYEPSAWWPLVALSATAAILALAGGAALITLGRRNTRPTSRRGDRVLGGESGSPMFGEPLGDE